MYVCIYVCTYVCMYACSNISSTCSLAHNTFTVVAIDTVNIYQHWTFIDCHQTIEGKARPLISHLPFLPIEWKTGILQKYHALCIAACTCATPMITLSALNKSGVSSSVHILYILCIDCSTHVESNHYPPKTHRILRTGHTIFSWILPILQLFLYWLSGSCWKKQTLPSNNPWTCIMHICMIILVGVARCSTVRVVPQHTEK